LDKIGLTWNVDAGRQRPLAAYVARALFGVWVEYADARRRSGVTIITTIHAALHKENQFTQSGGG